MEHALSNDFSRLFGTLQERHQVILSKRNKVWSVLGHFLTTQDNLEKRGAFCLKLQSVSILAVDNYSSQKDKALSVKTSKPNFVNFFMYFGNSLLDYLWNFLVCYGSKPGKHFARNLREFGAARSEELVVNQWIVQNIHWLSSQSERAKNTIHCFSIY